MSEYTQKGFGIVDIFAERKNLQNIRTNDKNTTPVSSWEVMWAGSEC